MTEDLRRSYWTLFDATMRFIEQGEAFEGEITALPPSEVPDSLLAAAQ